jgi:hypothetical protein
LHINQFDMNEYDKELVRLIAQQEIIKREISQMKKTSFWNFIPVIWSGIITGIIIFILIKLK